MPTDGDRLIYHLYADEGVESDYLSRFGRVVRVGLDPTDRNGSEPVAGDVSRLPLQAGADLAVAHPECGPWNTMNAVHGNADEQPRQVEDARRICQEVADHYIIENVPDAPLHDPVVLSGSTSGCPSRRSAPSRRRSTFPSRSCSRRSTTIARISTATTGRGAGGRR